MNSAAVLDEPEYGSYPRVSYLQKGSGASEQKLDCATEIRGREMMIGENQRHEEAGAVYTAMMDLAEEPIERRRFFEMIELSPVAMLITDPTHPDNPIQLANAAFCALTGYRKSEILGRNCRFLTGRATDPAASAEIRSAIEQERPALVEVINYRRDRTPFRNGVMITPLFDANGKLRWFLGSQVDLGAKERSGLTARESDAARRVSTLSVRQRQILAKMARGLLSKQIAWDLKISEKTVQMHRAHLLKRLGVATSAEAIRLAVEAGL
ncbi:PAS domain-containing protein [Sphingomonas sediminicola]|uniref:LuxR C-terminal-related transcriptional regulator n=1 Tax=Sphingomonas sediminicola TaxID=386874 RepID=UPI003CF87E27